MKRYLLILLISSAFIFTSCFNGKRLNDPVLLCIEYDYEELDYDVFEDLIRTCANRFSNKASLQIYDFEEAINE